VLIPLGAAVALTPLTSSAAGLVGGIVLALLVGNPYVEWTRRHTKTMIAFSVIALGAGTDLGVMLRVGASGALYTLCGIAFCLAVGTLLARAFRVGKDLGLLITVGTAICGGSAIAAVAPSIRAKHSDISVAMATVFLLNAAALFLFPVVGHWAGLDATRFGIWAALAIHDTSSVVGAALQYDPASVETATTLKLARALWIVPVAFSLGWWHTRKTAEGQTTKAKVPWFILGFVAAAAVVWCFPALRPLGKGVATLGRQGLVLTLFFIGAGLSRDAVRTVGLRPLLLGVALWVTVASAALVSIIAGLAG
jgi:uncharacterized integral membrane protein (TIGR00698 family)